MMLSEYEWQAVELSLQVSVLAVICSLPFGILMAWLLVRCQFPGKALLEGVIHLPLVLPPVVVGYMLLIAMGRRGVIGEKLYDWFGFSFSFSWRGAALASAVVAVSVDGARHPASVGGGGHQAGAGGAYAGSHPVAGIFHHHVAAVFARCDRRRGVGLRPLAG